MKKYLLLLMTLFSLSVQAQDFEQFFSDSTLRLDYIFAGDVNQQYIYVDQLSKSHRWYGRRHRLAELPLAGNGQITVFDKMTGIVIYRHSFSTLFQEWLATDEAKHTKKSFENVFLIPYPQQPVRIKVELRDYHDKVTAELVHEVDPKDILIRQLQRKKEAPYITLQQAADTTCCIHIAYVAEGYTAEQMDQYLDDCHVAMEALFEHEPFKTLRNRFNVIALCSPSHDSDVSQPGKGIWRNTALASHFDTFYMTRYLTTLHLKQLHDWLAGTPYEHIIVLANTAHYGGGGIYNSYNLSYTRGKHFRPVVVHEFGHSFGGLGDEYPYGDSDPMYFADTEPWEPNLTTTTKNPAKWQNLIDAGKAGLIEGGGYLSKGVWRGQEDCRMRTNEHPDFCPVCQQALTKLINFYTVR
ncbi:M64 family metallopeptidase [Prevotella sp. tf2-5]|uniref:M64 family metallopeptidase n=1 Tax=Prevotella sp. tf2-5 TaxID=1761889 RepID=UPI0008E2D42F|nr:M64 family metallopeptidase [Prevotella sp. tf2-5]SFO93860.1 Peptidase M64 N-terminus [Prevotella sp. tf2-5]